MKFLCVACDTPMKLHSTEMQQDQGSLSVIYSCSSCGQQTAMLTNRGETQLVTSLGVKIGPEGEQSTAKCPFSGMIQQGESDGAESVDVGGTVSESLPAEATQSPSGGPRWTAEANQRLEGVPEFVRPMAKMGIEQYASQHGYSEITPAVLDAAKAQFGF